MSEIITFPLPGGPNFTIPDIGDENWGQSVTDYLVAIPLGVPPTSGTFTLTGDLYFGASFGLVSQYYKSPTINPASAGIIRLAKTDLIDWRNNANSANLALGINGSDQLTFNGTPLITSTGNLTDTGTDGIVVTGGTGALVASASIAQHVADSSHNGYLSSTDWTTFNNKQSTLTLGNLTDTGTDGITVTGGTGAVVGSGTSLSQHVADTTHNGYLSSTDWNTFNSKGAGTVSSVALTVPAFLSVSGSPITSSGTLAVSLSGTALPVANGGTGQTTAGNLTDAGTDGITVTGGTGCLHTSASISQHVADASHNGYLSSVDWATFNSAAGGGITSLTGDVTGTGPGATATTLATVNSNIGSFTNANITVNAKGLITAAANGTSGTVNSGTAGYLAYYATSTNAISATGALQLINSGITELQIDGSATGQSELRLQGTGVTRNDLVLLATGGEFDISNTGTTTLTFEDVTNSVNFLTYTHPSAGLLTSAVVLAMGTNKITGLANGTASTDAAAFGQIPTPNIVTIHKASDDSVTGNTFGNTTFTVTITPSSSSAKILLIASGTGYSTTTSTPCYTITNTTSSTNLGGTSGLVVLNTFTALDSQDYIVAMHGVDSPASTSAQTYYVQAKNSTGGSNAAHFGDGYGYLTAMEIH